MTEAWPHCWGSGFDGFCSASRLLTDVTDFNLGRHSFKLAHCSAKYLGFLLLK